LWQKRANDNWVLDMKHLLAGIVLFTGFSFPAAASSIELIDNMVTGPKGKSSIITLGSLENCADKVCIDATGGDPKLNTASAQVQIAAVTAPVKKINFDFARKFPDPANPVASAPVEESAGGSASSSSPAAPADSGTIAAQPPVEPQPDTAAGGGQSADASADATRGAIDPNAPVMPIASSEAKEGE
jgi:hypothetical protein